MPENANRRRDLYDHLARATTATQPCPERATLDQHTPPGLRPSQKCCVACGRVTRRARNGDPWCGGDPVSKDGE